MKAIQLAIDQPITVAVGMILAIVAGLVGLGKVAIQMTPDVDTTVVSVTTRWENASPEEVESEVVDAQEEKLQGVEGLESMASTSMRSMGQIRLQFTTGTDKEVALREVSNKLREVQRYPQGVDEPVVEAADPESRDYIAWYLALCDDPDFDIRTLQDFFEQRVRPRLERIPGVAAVGVLGGVERETQVRFDPTLLAQRKITVPQLIAALQRTNQNVSAGALEQGRLDVRVRTIGRYATPQQILDTVVREDESGTVWVRDVATVTEGFKELDSFVRASGRRSIALNFERDPGSNLLEVMNGLRSEIDRLNAPGGLFDVYVKSRGIKGRLHLEPSYDSSDYVYQALDLVKSNIVIGGAIALIVLFLFLRSLRTVGIIAVSIPISVIGAVVLMLALGRSVNVISLAGMAFAVGMVVDNAIVVIENIFRHLEMGKTPRRAALEGTQEVAGAVLGSTLTTLIVFIPILLIQETAGQLFRDISLAICAAVGLSYVVSIFVIPSAAALFLRQRDAQRIAEHGAEHGKPHRGPLGRLFDLFDIGRIAAKVDDRLLGGWIPRLAVIAIFVAVSVIGTKVLIPPVDYLPTGNRNIVFGLMTPPPGYSITQSEKLGDRVQQMIAPFWAVSNTPKDKLPAIPTGWTPDAPKVVPPIIKQYFFVARDGALFHGAISSDPEKVVDLIPLFMAATSPAVLPGVQAFAFQLGLFRLSGLSGSAVKIDVSGDNLDRVASAAMALLGKLRERYGPYATRPTPSNFALPAPELQVVPDLVHAEDMGLSVADIGTTVQANGDGVIIGQYDAGDELIDLKVMSKRSRDEEYIASLADVPTATPHGDVTALGDVAEFRWTNAPEQIRRVGRQRAVTLELTPPAGNTVQEVVQKIDETVAELRQSGAVPADVDVQLAGTASGLAKVLSALTGDGSLVGLVSSSMFLAVLIVYLLMCVLYQSWLYPLVILFSVPLATFGGFLGLALVHKLSVADRYLPTQNLDILTLLGFVILAGVVVNNAILLVSQTQAFLAGAESLDLKPGEKVTPRRAIVLAVRSRVRPIFMSMLTSVGGMLPLVLMPGSGSELYRGLGAVVCGGLFVSTIFTLVLVPLVLGTVYDLRGERAWRKEEVSA
ncbi:MAG: efflux RND transporter permease subunit [Planctomycetota bacterium]